VLQDNECCSGEKGNVTTWKGVFQRCVCVCHEMEHAQPIDNRYDDSIALDVSKVCVC
jgi:hypothetical protein